MRERSIDPSAIWTDGSSLDSGGVGGAVTGYEEAHPPLFFNRRGKVGLGSRMSRTMYTYRDRRRSFLEAGSDWQSICFSMSPGHEAYDVEWRQSPSASPPQPSRE